MNERINIKETEAIRFYKELLDSNNSRIIFSAPFGVGKTSFLKEISTHESNKAFCPQQEFNFFHLYPVNYSVSNNADIFQYIKYDLIYSLIEKDVQFEKTDFDFLKSFKKYLKSNAHKVAAKLFLFIPQVGKDLFEIFEHLDKVKDEIIKACEDDIKDEGETFYNYLIELENKPGSIYEIDIYSKIIQNVLIRLSKATNTQNVLVIDDLDRIDPHHIFRLLNVFSAHLDINGHGNKFGFNKIIFVCDLNNIRKIFGNLYGQDVDFNGYIDKFYTKTVFKFINRETLINTLKEKLSPAPINEMDLGGADKKFIIDLLQAFMVNDILNFRSVLKADVVNNINKINHLYSQNKSNFIYCRLLGVSLFLRDLFGNYESFHSAIEQMEKLSSRKSDNSISDRLETIYYYYNLYLIVILEYKSHWWKNDAEINIQIGPNVAKFKLVRSGISSYYTESINNSVYPSSVDNFWTNFKKSVEILHEKLLL